jgi:hypothetical protein
VVGPAIPSFLVFLLARLSLGNEMMSQSAWKAFFLSFFLSLLRKIQLRIAASYWVGGSRFLFFARN